MQIGWEVAMLVKSRDREVTTNAGQSRTDCTGSGW